MPHCDPNFHWNPNFHYNSDFHCNPHIHSDWKPYVYFAKRCSNKSQFSWVALFRFRADSNSVVCNIENIGSSPVSIESATLSDMNFGNSTTFTFNGTGDVLVVKPNPIPPNQVAQVKVVFSNGNPFPSHSSVIIHLVLNSGFRRFKQSPLNWKFIYIFNFLTKQISPPERTYEMANIPMFVQW